MVYDIYFIVGVKFSPSSKVYYYLCDDYAVKNGDEVLVDFNGTQRELKVVDVKTVSESEAPFPVDKMKHVINRTLVGTATAGKPSAASTTSKATQSNSNTLEQNDQIILRDVPLAGGIYTATYDMNKHREKIAYEYYQKCEAIIQECYAKKSKYLTAYWALFAGSLVAAIALLTKALWIPLLITVICCAIPRWVLLSMNSNCNATINKERHNVKLMDFDYIVYHVVARGGRITHKNKETGTISFCSANGVKHSISVYTGYNSHYRGY